MTLSDAEQGAQVAVYSESGQSLATLNRGGALRPQWRIGVGGGADPLNLVAQQDGVTSHPVFSRNLDMALAVKQ